MYTDDIRVVRGPRGICGERTTSRVTACSNRASRSGESALSDLGLTEGVLEIRVLVGSTGFEELRDSEEIVV